MLSDFQALAAQYSITDIADLPETKIINPAENPSRDTQIILYGVTNGKLDLYGSRALVYIENWKIQDTLYLPKQDLELARSLFWKYDWDSTEILGGQRVLKTKLAHGVKRGQTINFTEGVITEWKYEGNTFICLENSQGYFWIEGSHLIPFESHPLITLYNRLEKKLEPLLPLPQGIPGYVVKEWGNAETVRAIWKGSQEPENLVSTYYAIDGQVVGYGHY